MKLLIVESPSKAKTIEKYENAINKLGTENFNKYAKYDNMKSRLDILLKLREDMTTEKQRKYDIRDREEYLNFNFWY